MIPKSPGTGFGVLKFQNSWVILEVFLLELNLEIKVLEP